MRFRKLFLFIPLLAGCYAYTPVGTGTTPAGHDLRVFLTDAGTANLAAQVGPSVEAVTGRLVSETADAYTLSVASTRRRNGVEQDWNGEEISVSRSLVSTVQRREFSRGRTAAITAGVIAGIFLIREAFLGSGGTFGGAPPGPPPTPR